MMKENLQESATGFGAQTAPTDGLAIATIGPSFLPAGLYRVDARLQFTGAAGTTDGAELRRGANTVARISITPVNNTTGQPWLTVYVRLSGADSLSINAVGAGPAMSVYSGSIIATKVAD